MKKKSKKQIKDFKALQLKSKMAKKVKGGIVITDVVLG